METDCSNLPSGAEAVVNGIPGILAKVIIEGIKYGFSAKRIATKCLRVQYSWRVKCGICNTESRVMFLSGEALLKLHTAAKRIRPEEVEPILAERFSHFRLVCGKCGAMGQPGSNATGSAAASPAKFRSALAS